MSSFQRHPSSLRLSGSFDPPLSGDMLSGFTMQELLEFEEDPAVSMRLFDRDEEGLPVPTLSQQAREHRHDHSHMGFLLHSQDAHGVDIGLRDGSSPPPMSTPQLLATPRTQEEDRGEDALAQTQESIHGRTAGNTSSTSRSNGRSGIGTTTASKNSTSSNNNGVSQGLSHEALLDGESFARAPLSQRQQRQFSMQSQLSVDFDALAAAANTPHSLFDTVIPKEEECDFTIETVELAEPGDDLNSIITLPGKGEVKLPHTPMTLTELQNVPTKFPGPFGLALVFPPENKKKPIPRAAPFTYSKVLNRAFMVTNFKASFKFRLKENPPKGTRVRIRMLYTQSEYRKEIVKRCPNHKEQTIGGTHLMKIDVPGATYVMEETGHLSVVFPFTSLNFIDDISPTTSTASSRRGSGASRKGTTPSPTPSSASSSTIPSPTATTAGAHAATARKRRGRPPKHGGAPANKAKAKQKKDTPKDQDKGKGEKHEQEKVGVHAGKPPSHSHVEADAAVRERKIRAGKGGRRGDKRRVGASRAAGTMQPAKFPALPTFDPSQHEYAFPIEVFCFSSCLGGLNRRPVEMIVSLEHSARVLASDSIDVRICACPGRDRMAAEARLLDKGKKKRRKVAPTLSQRVVAGIDDERIHMLEIQGRTNYELLKHLIQGLTDAKAKSTAKGGKRKGAVAGQVKRENDENEEKTEKTTLMRRTTSTISSGKRSANHVGHAAKKAAKKKKVSRPSQGSAGAIDDDEAGDTEPESDGDEDDLESQAAINFTPQSHVRHAFLTKHLSAAVRAWLMALKMQQYIDPFLSNGFDDLEIVCDIDEDDLTEVGVVIPGHRKKLMLAVRRLRTLIAQAKAEEKQGTMVRRVTITRSRFNRKWS